MKFGPALLSLSLAVAGSSMAPAQDTSTPANSTPVLQITVEYLKPYKGGMAHDKTESAFVAAFRQAKSPAYYIGMNAMSGKSRALFMTRYASFAEWEKINKMQGENAELSSAIENAGLADGELLDELDSMVFTYNPELSYHSHSDLQNHRVYQITVFRVRLGHRKDWADVVKMVKDAHDKMGDKAHWGMYEMAYGGAEGTYIVISGDPSASVIDDAMASGKKFVEAMGGEEAMAKLDQLYGAAVESSHSELFSVNPRQSYVSDDWIKQDPDFWNPKPQQADAKPAEKTVAAAPVSGSR